jgi:hypothetical protein
LRSTPARRSGVVPRALRAVRGRSQRSPLIRHRSRSTGDRAGSRPPDRRSFRAGEPPSFAHPCQLTQRADEVRNVTALRSLRHLRNRPRAHLHLTVAQAVAKGLLGRRIRPSPRPAFTNDALRRSVSARDSVRACDLLPSSRRSSWSQMAGRDLGASPSRASAPDCRAPVAPRSSGAWGVARRAAHSHAHPLRPRVGLRRSRLELVTDERLVADHAGNVAGLIAYA